MSSVQLASKAKAAHKAKAAPKAPKPAKAPAPASSGKKPLWGSTHKWQAVLIGLAVLLVVVLAITLPLVLGKNGGSGGRSGTGTGNPTLPRFRLPKPKVVVEPDARKFFAIASTDQELGLDLHGVLRDGDGKELEPGIGENKADLERYPTTYPLGHPYWQNEWGQLSEANWQNYAARFDENAISKLVPDAGQALTGARNVLVVEARSTPGVGGDAYEYAPVVIDMDMDLAGLVVRKGGIVLFAGREGGPEGGFKLRTRFILVESGGLLQAGSAFGEGDSHRYAQDLDVTLTHPPGGYDACGSVASQYSYIVYAPGARRSEDVNPATQLQTLFTGTSDAFRNTFGPKVCAAGFNGSYHLAGRLGSSLPYTGTWSSYVTATGAPWTGEAELVTKVGPTDPAAVSGEMPAAYPASWLRLSNTRYNPGDTVVRVDAADLGAPGARSLAGWRVGDRVVLTGVPEQFTVKSDPLGILPLWLEHPTKPERDANTEANRYFEQYATATEGPPADKSNGVEVAVIAAVDPEAGTVTLAGTGLKFAHDSRHTVINRTPADLTGGVTPSVTVGTAMHIGLLSRAITIQSQLDSGGTGFNVLLADRQPIQRGVWAGPRGGLICNSEERNPAGTEVYSTCYQNLSATGANVDYCGSVNAKPPQITQGKWTFGTATQSGTNSIFMGHQMWRYGSSVRLDGVRMYRMGTNGASGSLARYATHFHLAGYPRSWDGYLPRGSSSYGTAPAAGGGEPEWRREAAVENCSFEITGSRWISIHGTHEVTFRNNTCLLCYGSGVFVEDGTETQNLLDHNLLIYGCPAAPNPYYNPAPQLYPDVSTDVNPPSLLWLRSPAPVPGRGGRGTFNNKRGLFMKRKREEDQGEEDWWAQFCSEVRGRLALPSTSRSGHLHMALAMLGAALGGEGEGGASPPTQAALEELVETGARLETVERFGAACRALAAERGWKRDTLKCAAAVLRKVLALTALPPTFIARLALGGAGGAGAGGAGGEESPLGARLGGGQGPTRARIDEWVERVRLHSRNQTNESLRGLFRFWLNRLLPALGLGVEDFEPEAGAAPLERALGLAGWGREGEGAFPPAARERLRAVCGAGQPRAWVRKLRWVNLLLRDVLGSELPAVSRHDVWSVVELRGAGQFRAPGGGGGDPHRISTADLERLYAAVQGHVRDELWFRLLLTTGMRVGGLVSIKLADVMDCEASPPVVRAEGRTVEKGGKPFMFLLTTQVRKLVGEWVTTLRPANGSPYLFPSVRDARKPAGRSTVRDFMRRACERAGLQGPQFHPHALRHTYAHLLLEEGHGVAVIARLLGHANSETTERFYLRESAAEVATRAHIPWLADQRWRGAQRQGVPRFLVPEGAQGEEEARAPAQPTARQQLASLAMFKRSLGAAPAPRPPPS